MDATSGAVTDRMKTRTTPPNLAGKALFGGALGEAARAWFGRAPSRETIRYGAIREMVMELGRQDFLSRNHDPRMAPVVVLISSYLEADNIEAVLKAVPDEVGGEGVTTLVVVDGGDDATPQVVAGHDALCAVLPANMGQGVALKLGYELASRYGAMYVVTVDADGQNDPTEIEALLKPILDDEADFVVASRRLGDDRTTDKVRQYGVVTFAAIINRITGLNLTDTSNGFRALRIEVLDDVVLDQDQYQTSELIISAAAGGWRITEVPTVWYPRASGTSKKGRNAFFGFRYARVVTRTALREMSGASSHQGPDTASASRQGGTTR